MRGIQKAEVVYLASDRISVALETITIKLLQRFYGALHR